jgi:hypothetical protein
MPEESKEDPPGPQENEGGKGGFEKAASMVGNFGSEVDVQEFHKNLMGISRELQKNFREYCMYFWYLVYEIRTKFLVNSQANSQCPLRPQARLLTCYPTLLRGQLRRLTLRQGMRWLTIPAMDGTGTVASVPNGGWL